MTIIDFYSETNQSGLVVLGSGITNGAGQAFNAPIGNDANYVKFQLKKFGSPTGDVRCKLTTVTGTVGTDAIPDTVLGTSNVIDAAVLTTSLQIIEFAFDPAIPITGGTDYAVYVEYDGGTPTDVVHVGWDVSSPTHPGNATTRFDTGSYTGIWTGGSGQDFIFEFGFATVPGVICKPFVLPDGRRFVDEGEARTEYARLMQEEALIRARIEAEKREAGRLLAIELAKPRLPNKTWKLSPRQKIEPQPNPARSRTGLLDSVDQPRLYKD